MSKSEIGKWALIVGVAGVAIMKALDLKARGSVTGMSPREIGSAVLVLALVVGLALKHKSL